MQTASVIGSTVFRRVMLASGAFILASLAAMWLLVGSSLLQIDREEWREINAIADEAEAVFSEDGLEGLIGFVSHDGDEIWDPDVLFERLEEEEPIFALRDDFDTLLAGYEDLWAEEVPGKLWLEHPEIDGQIRAQDFWLTDSTRVAIARFAPEREQYLVWLLENMTLALFLVSLPLSLTIGFFLSKSVLGRIEAISRTVNDVGEEAMTARAPVRGNNDEFDRLSTNINDMLDRLEALNKNIQAVTVGVAHDLKTPLANIGGRLELMRADLDKPEATHAHLDAAETYLGNLLRVFDGLLRLGEIEAGRRRAAFADLNLSTLVAQMGEAYAPLFEDAQKRFEIAVPDGIALEGDQELVEQLLSNLLDNALEHSRDGAHVRLILERDAHHIALSVADDGPGIPPLHRERIFDRFYRGDASRTTPGNGLGLSLVRAIAELHFGRARVEDRTDATIVRIEFPRDSATH
ncbi:MAG: ATP-binding protein [Pseudomonadota bacterium]